MTTSSKITRRTILQAGVGVAAGAVSSNLFADATATKVSGVTPEQTEGPFYPKHEQADTDRDLTLIEGHSERAEGELLYVSGQVFDDDHKLVADALVDVWQANTHGRYDHEEDPNPAPLDKHFQGWAKIRTDEQGRYSFKTIVPGAYQVSESWWRPPHIHFKISKRGYHEITTQMYFADHALNEKDGIFLDTPKTEREKLILAHSESRAGDASGSKRGVFDIILRRVKKA